MMTDYYDDDGFMDWFSNKFEENAVLFAEFKEEEFEEYCFRRYTERGEDRYEED